MTTPISPVADAALPLPDPADLGTWGARMAEMHRWMREDLRSGMNSLAEDTYTNAEAAISVANYKGAWSGLTGTLSVPASVSHGGKLWILLSSVGDVTAETPGVSSAWEDITPLKAADVVPIVGGAAQQPTWTTAGRPATPSDGNFGFNTDLECLEFWSAAYSSWVQTKEQSATAAATGTAVDFPVIPPWAKRCAIGFSKVSTNGSSNPLIQLGDSGGVEVTSYDDCVSARLTAGTAIGTYTTGIGINSGSAANSISGVIVLERGSGNTWNANGDIAVGGVAMIVTAGSKTLSGTMTTVRLTTVNGTDAYDVGTFSISWS